MTTVAQVHTHIQRATTATTATQGGRVLALDALRVLAALAVVYIHVTASVLLTPAWLHRPGWWVAVLLDSASRWCVPMFVMLSGALALTYRARMTSRRFFTKRVTRVAVPFVIWTAIYLIWAAQMHLHRIASPADVLANTLYAPAMYHLWFFYLLLGLYLVTPILAVLVQAASRTTLWAFVALCFLSPLLGLYSHFMRHTLYVAAYVPQLAYVGYYVLGYLLRDARPSAWIRWLLYLDAAAVVAFTAIETYQLSLAHGALDDTLFNYTLPLQAVVASALWIGAQEVPWERVLRWQWERAALSSLALATFGIYLLHVIVKVSLEQQAIFMQTLPMYSVRYVLVAAPLTFVVTALLIVGVRAIPGMSRIIAWLIP